MAATPRPLVLGIETSCDDTACAVVNGDGRVLASTVSSQLDAHRPFGGVVPEIASREHLSNWPTVSSTALDRAGVDWGEIDLVAATRGPGLVGSLLVGLSLGKALAYALGRPFHGVHHLEGHLFSPFIQPEGTATPIPDRFVGLVVSGGHTALFLREAEELTSLAHTRDDAMGEAFDKIGKRLGLPFPGGPGVDLLAEAGRASAHPLTVPMCGESLDFSFSGLKSQALLGLSRLEDGGLTPPPPTQNAAIPEAFAAPILDLVAGFRAAAVAQLLNRLDRLHRQSPIELLAVSGGVAANRLLRRELVRWAGAGDVDLRLVDLSFSGDNAAMIAFAALLRHRRGEGGDPRLAPEARSRLPI